MEGYQHISGTERVEIEAHLKAGLPISKIAAQLGRHRSTIYREIGRNGHKVHRYVSEVAERRAVKRRRGAKAPLLLRSEATRFYVIDKLRQCWTPEQISAKMRKDGEPFYVCHETIYQFLYGPHAREEQLYKLLPSKRYARLGHCSRTPQNSRIPAALSIHNRGKRIDNRRRYGDWEGDLVMGKRGTGNVTTLVDRKSRFAIAIKNPSKHSDIVIEGIMAATRECSTNCVNPINRFKKRRIEGDTWIAMLEDRNVLSHVYDDAKAAAAVTSIVEQYLPAIVQVHGLLQGKLSEANKPYFNA